MESTINDLLDPILCHILSFLPTQYAVRTSSLSKRWKNLWRNSDTLNLDCYNNKRFNNWGKRKFATFVNKALAHRNVVSSVNSRLTKFSLVWTTVCDKKNIHEWLYWAIDNNVQHFILQNFKNRVESLPSRLYSCNTLEVLELRGEIMVNCPGTIFLPRLKTLRLITVHYEDGERDVCKLISSCPMLQSLYIERNGYDNVSKFVISSRGLKNLKVKISNDGSLETREEELCLEINTPKLEYLSLMDNVSETYSMVNISSLIRANVDVNIINIPVGRISNEGKIKRVESFARLMQALHKVSDLYISLPNLKCYQGETINWREPSHVPRCVYSCLKGISIGSFACEECEDEFAMLSYILENAQVLQNVKLHASCRNIREKYRVLQRITKFPRKSQACQIDFV